MHSLFFLLFMAILLTSCNSSKSIHLKDTSDSLKVDSSNSINTKQFENATIVHIDKKQRVITVRCTCPLKHQGYYTTHSELSNKQNSLIKLYDSSYESIYIGDILEGTPNLNDLLSKVEEEKSLELDEFYTEAVID